MNRAQDGTGLGGGLGNWYLFDWRGLPHRRSIALLWRDSLRLRGSNPGHGQGLCSAQAPASLGLDALSGFESSVSWGEGATTGNESRDDGSVFDSCHLFEFGWVESEVSARLDVVNSPRDGVNNVVVNSSRDSVNNCTMIASTRAIFARSDRSVSQKLHNARRRRCQESTQTNHCPDHRPLHGALQQDVPCSGSHASHRLG